VEKIKTRILYSLALFFENRAVYKIMWKKYDTAREATDDNVIRRIRIAYWITNATNIHPEYVRNYHYTLRNSPEERRSNIIAFPW